MGGGLYTLDVAIHLTAGIECPQCPVEVRVGRRESMTSTPATVIAPPLTRRIHT